VNATSGEWSHYTETADSTYTPMPRYLHTVAALTDDGVFVVYGGYDDRLRYDSDRVRLRPYHGTVMVDNDEEALKHEQGVYIRTDAYAYDPCPDSLVWIARTTTTSTPIKSAHCNNDNGWDLDGDACFCFDPDNGLDERCNPLPSVMMTYLTVALISLGVLGCIVGAFWETCKAKVVSPLVKRLIGKSTRNAMYALSQIISSVLDVYTFIDVRYRHESIRIVYTTLFVIASCVSLHGLVANVYLIAKTCAHTREAHEEDRRQSTRHTPVPLRQTDETKRYEIQRARVKLSTSQIALLDVFARRIPWLFINLYVVLVLEDDGGGSGGSGDGSDGGGADGGERMLLLVDIVWSSIMLGVTIHDASGIRKLYQAVALAMGGLAVAVEIDDAVETLKGEGGDD